LLEICFWGGILEGAVESGEGDCGGKMGWNKLKMTSGQ
jgi:hypothetical protein